MVSKKRSVGRSNKTGRFVHVARKGKKNHGFSARINESDIMSAVRSDSIESAVYLDRVAKSGVPTRVAKTKAYTIKAMVAYDVLPRKTWEHAKKSKRNTLTPANSERLIRVLRITEKARDAFGENMAEDWLETPTSAFDDRAPIEMLTTESGARAVELYLGQVMHGFNA